MLDLKRCTAVKVGWPAVVVLFAAGGVALDAPQAANYATTLLPSPRLALELSF
jgi:hypothetical protein